LELDVYVVYPPKQYLGRKTNLSQHLMHDDCKCQQYLKGLFAYW